MFSRDRMHWGEKKKKKISAYLQLVKDWGARGRGKGSTEKPKGKNIFEKQIFSVETRT